MSESEQFIRVVLGVSGNIQGLFGRLTGKHWRETQYKHVDHHLRQFGL